LNAKLEVAIGLETVHPELIKRLNKQMTLDDFRDSVTFLSKNNIKSRAFILLRPPFLSEEEGVYWAKKSIDFAFEVGIGCCTIIPVRAGNGAMDFLEGKGDFNKPTIQSLEDVLEYGVNQNKGNVFADIWDLQLFSNCDNCLNERIKRITNINLNQKIIDKVKCSCKN
jgi:hypothetical protein